MSLTPRGLLLVLVSTRNEQGVWQVHGCLSLAALCDVIAADSEEASMAVMEHLEERALRSS